MVEQFLIDNAIKIITLLVLGISAISIHAYKSDNLRKDFNKHLADNTEKTRLNEHIAVFKEYKKNNDQNTQNIISEIKKDINKIQTDQSNLSGDQRVIINEQQNWREFSGKSLQRIEDAVAVLSARQDNNG